MKILVISSTPRSGGNSEILAKRFAEGAKDGGAETELVLLREKKINYCLGCETCSALHKPCPQKDDAAEIIRKMIQADTIVLASPVYFYSVCAQMKTLIDRCCARYTEISGKKFAFILTAAENSPEATEGAEDVLKCFLKCLENPKIINTIRGTGFWHKGDIDNSEVFREAYQAGLSAATR